MAKRVTQHASPRLLQRGVRTVPGQGVDIVLLLLSLFGCGKGELALVVFEGEIAPELELAGEMSFRTYNGFFPCKRNLLQSPHPKSLTVHGRFVRQGKRYRLTLDTKDAPRGGFCDWRPKWIAVEPRFNSKEGSPDTAVSLKPIHALTESDDDEAAAKFPAVVRCGPGRYNAKCEHIRGTLEDSSEEVHLGLDVLYEESYVPPRE